MIIRSLAILLLALLGAEGLLAQGGPTTLEFSFSNPGARSLGFGGAFAALADDATAAFANPAGLTQLARPEVSIEGRLWSYSLPFTAGGRLSGEPTGNGLDTAPGLRTSRSEEDLSDLSFLSFVYPRKKWSLAIYRHQLAKFDNFTETQGFFSDPPGTRLPDFRRLIRFQITSLAVAAGWQVNERLSLGAGISSFDTEALIQTDRYGTPALTLPDGLYGENAYRPEALEEADSVIADDRSIGFNAGFLLRLSESWSLGGFLRQGPKVEIDNLEVAGPAYHPQVPAGTILDFQRDSVKLPNVFGVGVAYRSPGGRLTIASEWDRVEYSSILESIDPQFVEPGIVLDDGDELRVGAEYAFLTATPVVALRLGAWLDPDHRIRFTGGNLLDRAIFRGGDDELHLAAGLGLAFRDFQIDVAVDLSDLVDTASISAIYSF